MQQFALQFQAVEHQSTAHGPSSSCEGLTDLAAWLIIFSRKLYECKSMLVLRMHSAIIDARHGCTVP